MNKPEEACPLPLGGNDERIRAMLEKPCTVAVVGMSPKPERPSNEVGIYLHRAGFQVIPVHPAGGEISGLTVYPSLEEIPADPADWDVTVRGAAGLAKTLRQQQDDALLFRDLATLRTDHPVFDDVDELHWRGPTQEFTECCSRLGVKGLSQRAQRGAR